MNNRLFRAKIGLSTAINNPVVFLPSTRPFLVCGFLFSWILPLGCKRAALSLDIPTASQARIKKNGDGQRKDTLPETLPTLARTVSHGHSWLKQGLRKWVFNKYEQENQYWVDNQQWPSLFYRSTEGEVLRSWNVEEGASRKFSEYRCSWRKGLCPADKEKGFQAR